MGGFGTLSGALAGLSALLVANGAEANPFGYHEHDGFYFRFQSGVSLLDVERSTDRAGVTTSGAYGKESRVTGPSVFTEVSVGGTLGHRLVIAGTLLGDNLPAELAVASGSHLDLGSPLTFAMIAPTVDYFPHRSGGFHFGGGIGWAAAIASINDPIFDTIGGGGVGLTLGGGYDAWVADDWSLGVGLRGIVARIRGEQQANGATGSERDTAISVSLAFSVLCH
jgi:hypothetical protein